MAQVTPDTDAARQALLDAAASIVASEGVDALTTRRLATEVGRSTMAVYTWFGSKPNLLRALYHEAFSRFRDRLMSVAHTDDPLADLVALGAAYRHHALTDPNLYEIMFGSSNRYFSPDPEDLMLAVGTFEILVAAIARCVDSGDLRGDPQQVAMQVWSAVHGAMSLELGRGLGEEGSEWRTTYEALGRTLLLGLGADPARVDRIQASWVSG